MGQVIVRNLDDQVIETHRRRAKARGVSLEQELRDVLRRAAMPTGDERLRRASEIAALTPGAASRPGTHARGGPDP